MTPKRYQLVTTLYGKRLLSAAQLFELHREVARAAARARLDDPNYMAVYRTGVAAGRRA